MDGGGIAMRWCLSWRRERKNELAVVRRRESSKAYHLCGRSCRLQPVRRVRFECTSETARWGRDASADADVVRSCDGELLCGAGDMSCPYTATQMVKRTICFSSITGVWLKAVVRSSNLNDYRLAIANKLLINDYAHLIIETFQLKISEEQLMSRCTKCNGNFIQKPLTIEEAIAASRGFQVIPDCLFDRNLEFWQCTDCKQLYWETNVFFSQDMTIS
ncbi:hypothetical protein MUK42_20393 [Musa troglodytarum]|uniref:Mut7-C RNAse domain-containing protein n=1 Tax=Musa troglodytarum TaxID=320322 RepID=A0A9E7FSB3_9LILI|nr:hypothetical protein MUK42_20393 [Musa troglodytarum]